MLDGYSFGTAAAGTFTTGAAATDLGYVLLTELTITSLNGATGLVTQTSFEQGSAFDPATGAFLNHYAGNTYPDYGGGFDTTGRIGSVVDPEIDGFSFSAGSVALSLNGGDQVATGQLVVTPAEPSSVPEPASAEVAAAGLLALGMIRRRSALRA